MLIKHDKLSHEYLMIQPLDNDNDNDDDDCDATISIDSPSISIETRESTMLIDDNNSNLQQSIPSLNTDYISKNSPLNSPDICITNTNENNAININTVSKKSQNENLPAILDCSDNPNITKSSPNKDYCRYCYEIVSADENYSCCYCHSSLCKECLIRELDMTLNRQQSELKCTVCFYHYNCRFVRNLDNCCNIIRHGLAETYTLRHENGDLLSWNSIQTVLGLLFLLLLFPSCTVAVILYVETTVYGFLTVADLIMNWSIRLFALRCEEFIQPIIHFILCLFHVIRIIILLECRPHYSHGHANEVYLITACSIVYALLYLYSTYTIFYPRYVNIMNRFALLYVENKGPFSQEEIDEILNCNNEAENDSNDSDDEYLHIENARDDHLVVIEMYDD